jgi:transcription initiation factor TFIIIB Brf1 subunit/transcription initiation factor TFIIB
MSEDCQSQSSLESETINTDECPACNSGSVSELIPEIGPVCEECGVVVSAPIEIEQPTTEFEQDSEQIPPWSEFYAVTNSTEQNVAQAFEILENIGGKLDVSPPIRERAAEIYTDAALRDLTDGRSTELLIAACVTTAGRENQSPIPAGTVASLIDNDVESIRRICSELRRELEYDISPCPPKEYIANLVQVLDLGEEAKTVANRILSAVPDQSIGGKNPGAMAGAALYLAADGEVTQRDVADSTAVTTETIRVRVNDCEDAIGAKTEIQELF